MTGACPPRRHPARCLSPTGDFEAGSRGRILLSGYDNGGSRLKATPDAILPSPRLFGGGFLRRFFQVICICFT